MGGMFLIQQDESLVELNEQPYESEELLQSLLASYPNLLSGDQKIKGEPLKFLLIAREAGLPSEQDGGNRWAIDHLFLDQYAIPTIVEVKRSSDTRIRREVVGQMLDYAANAVTYWSVDKLQNMFEKTCSDSKSDSVAKIADFIGEQNFDFWDQAKTNLQAGKIRLIFVADEIPSELQRIVEFLNEQMNPAEVLAIEVKQYVGNNLRTLVPKVIGQTAVAAGVKHNRTSKEGKPWDKTTFLKYIAERKGETYKHLAEKILCWAQERSLGIRWGSGACDGTFFPIFDELVSPKKLFAVWTKGIIEIQLQEIAKHSPFNDEDKKSLIVEKLNAINGIRLENDAKYPSFDLELIAGEKEMKSFLDIFDWVIDQFRN